MIGNETRQFRGGNVLQPLGTEQCATLLETGYAFEVLFWTILLRPEHCYTLSRNNIVLVQICLRLELCKGIYC
jgi:hypothetical protein